MKYLLAAFIVPVFCTTSALAGGGDPVSADSGSATPQRRSAESSGSYPGGPVNKAPLATGYYATDNDDPPMGARWTPRYQFIDTSDYQYGLWRRVLSGPNQAPMTQWTQRDRPGREYMRNPNQYTVQANGKIITDSTDNAIAGPIALGIPFYYYGRLYDSFYVSSNGLVGLSNRRYSYDTGGVRTGYNIWRDDIRPVDPSGALADPTPDDYGQRYVCLNNSTTSATAGMLSPDNTLLPNPALRPVMAPLWDDLELSQFDAQAARPDDYGRVYWQRDVQNNIVRITFMGLTMKGTKHYPVVKTNAAVPSRALRADIQVALNASDSSVTFHYRFSGAVKDPGTGILIIPARDMFAANATIGIQSHEQEFTNYLYNAGFEGKVYVNGDAATTPRTQLAISFKQWKNVTRIVGLNYQIPDRANPQNFISLPPAASATNFELLLGNLYLGTLRAVCVVQNVSDAIYDPLTATSGVNYTQQGYDLRTNNPPATSAQFGVRFGVTFRVRDAVNLQAPPTFQRTKSTRALCPIRLENPTNRWYSRDTITFDPYTTDSTQAGTQAGRFRAEVITTDRGPGNEVYGETWPFDDTLSAPVYGINRLTLPLINTFNDYDYAEGEGLIPATRKFVSYGTQVVDGDGNTYHPPPPRGPAGAYSIWSPVCLLDRNNAGGTAYTTAAGGLSGDTLVSFPIDIGAVTRQPVLVFSYQRGGRLQYPRGFSDARRLGPEHAVYNTAKTAIQYQNPDRLLVEFAEPGADSISNVTNPTVWRDPAFTASSAVKWPSGSTVPAAYATTAPRWGIFGGGGGSYSDTSGKVIVNELDPGKDLEFQHAMIPIPARWYANPAVRRSFRFRIRLEAKDDGSDDSDPVYIDNIFVTEPVKPEIEVVAVGADWPYTEATASAARAIPLYVHLANNGSTAATAFGCSMSVQTPAQIGTPYSTYYRYISVVALRAGQDTLTYFPSWNAQECGSALSGNSLTPVTNTYRLSAFLDAGVDSYAPNDATYHDFDLRLGPTIAYDDGTSDVPGFAQSTGKGLNLPGKAQDGAGSFPYGQTGSTGTFAVKFTVPARDTLLGYAAYFGSIRTNPDGVQYWLYKQAANAAVNAAPQTVVAGTLLNAQRGQGRPEYPADTVRTYNFDEYVTVMLDTPAVLDPGVYYAAISNTAGNLELGGDMTRQGQVTTVRDATSSGAANVSIPVYPEMRQIRFWYEVTRGSANWQPMITSSGNPGYPHLNWSGTVSASNVTNTRGSWIPMLRPYFGPKTSRPCSILPVELARFTATPLRSAVRLDWSTASEVNNSGFFIERRAENQALWDELGFAGGHGTSSAPQAYTFTDTNVVPQITYQYRLRQTDLDGSVQYSPVRQCRLSGAGLRGPANVLYPCTPNPASGPVAIRFDVAEPGLVSLSIYDMYGHTVRTFAIDARPGGQGNQALWDGCDQHGAPVPEGTYLYRLYGQGFRLCRTLNVVR